jgi:radical SAM protein with 4Fe4S-binding SPASM domain
LPINDRLKSNRDIKERIRRIATFPLSGNLYETAGKSPLSPFEDEKIKLMLDHFEKAEKARIVPPAMVRIYLSSACHHNCAGCSFADNQTENKVFFNASCFRKLSEDLRLMNIGLVDLTGGGEPTLHPQFEEFVKMGLKLKFRLALLSNGSWNDSGLIDLLADGFAFIRVNLDACSEEVYARVHRSPVGGEFQRIMNNLERLISEREKRKSGLVVGAKVRLSQINMNFAEGMITLTKDLGLDYIQFQIDPSGSTALLPEQERNVHEILSELKNKYQSLSVYGKMEGKKTGERCWASKAQLTIDASGNAYSCPHFLKQPDATCWGNILNQNTNNTWLSHILKSGFTSAGSWTCLVENCRWRFYDEVIRQRIKTRLRS